MRIVDYAVERLTLERILCSNAGQHSAQEFELCKLLRSDSGTSDNATEYMQ